MIPFGLDPSPNPFEHPLNGLVAIRVDGSDLTDMLGRDDFKREPDWVKLQSSRESERQSHFLSLSQQKKRFTSPARRTYTDFQAATRRRRRALRCCRSSTPCLCSCMHWYTVTLDATPGDRWPRLAGCGAGGHIRALRRTGGRAVQSGGMAGLTWLRRPRSRHPAPRLRVRQPGMGAAHLGGAARAR